MKIKIKIILHQKEIHFPIEMGREGRKIGKKDIIKRNIEI